MAFKVDPKKVAAKAAEEAKKAASRGGPRKLWWKPRPGKNKIRIMPAWTDEGPNALQFWREVYVHWGVGEDENNQQHFSCPKMTPPGGEECPVCDEYEKLKSSTDPAEKEAAGELRPRQRAYSNIIDIDDPVWTAADVQEMKAQGADGDNLPGVGDPKIQVFSYGPKILKQLLDLFCDSPDICDIDAGHNIFIVREGQGIQTEYRVSPEIKKTPAPCKGEPKLHNLDDVMPFKEPAEMLAALQGIEVEEARQLRGEEPKAELPASEEPEPESESNSVGEVADAVGEEPAEEVAEEAAEGDGDENSSPWLDDEGNFSVPGGYHECFSFERDYTDEVCNSQCEAFEECKQATIFRCNHEGVEIPEKAIEPEKPKKQAKKKAVRKPKAAKKAAKAEEEKPQEPLGEPAVASGGTNGTKAVEDLESRMKAAIQGR